MTPKLPDNCFALTQSLSELFMKEERPLGTHWLPERPFPKNQARCVRGRSSQDFSGRSGIIRVIAVPTTAARKMAESRGL
jgi:hypothetical protein